MIVEASDQSSRWIDLRTPSGNSTESRALKFSPKTVRLSGRNKRRKEMKNNAGTEKFES